MNNPNLPPILRTIKTNYLRVHTTELFAFITDWEERSSSLPLAKQFFNMLVKRKTRSFFEGKIFVGDQIFVIDEVKKDPVRARFIEILQLPEFMNEKSFKFYMPYVRYCASKNSTKNEIRFLITMMLRWVDGEGSKFSMRTAAKVWGTDAKRILTAVQSLEAANLISKVTLDHWHEWKIGSQYLIPELDE